MSSDEDLVAYESLSEDEAAILDMRLRRLYTLNATAKFIYERARDGQNAAAIAAEMAREFDVEAERCEGDVETFLAELRQAGLL